MKTRYYPYMLVLPTFLLVMLFLAYPLVEVFRVSFTDTFLLRPTSGGFVGLKTYAKVLSSEEFPAVFLRTLLWIGVGTVGSMILGLAIGYFLSFEWTVNRILRAVIIIPWIIPPVISSHTWGWILNSRFGVINDILIRFGLIEKGIAFLGEPKIAIFALSQILVWRNVPIVAILLSAAFQGIPQSLTEAARIDGAGRIDCFFHITIPQLKHAMLVALLFRSIDAFRSFDMLYVLTRGGPGGSTEILSLLAYKNLFQYLDFGKGSAITVVMAVVTTALSIMYIRVLSGPSEKEVG